MKVWSFDINNVNNVIFDHWFEQKNLWNLLFPLCACAIIFSHLPIGILIFPIFIWLFRVKASSSSSTTKWTNVTQSISVNYSNVIIKQFFYFFCFLFSIFCVVARYTHFITLHCIAIHWVEFKKKKNKQMNENDVHSKVCICESFNSRK